jgi:hypothetical protein
LSNCSAISCSDQIILSSLFFKVYFYSTNQIIIFYFLFRFPCPWSYANYCLWVWPHFVPRDLWYKLMTVSQWLILNMNNFSAKLWQVQVASWWEGDTVHFLLTNSLICNFHSASSLKQQSVDRYFAPLRHIIQTTSQPVSILTP